MTGTGFSLDPRLAADTYPVISLPLCDVLLMNDARYPWLILVPRRAGTVEISDLDADEQTLLWQEVNRARAAPRTVAPCDTLNPCALGNNVRQLHVHIVARREGDAAWPGPVWGHGHAVAYQHERFVALITSLRQTLAN
jgi:diadenosine tetraphosphate (Ap4A) HIT family hydrolase